MGIFLDQLEALNDEFRKEAGFTQRLSETPDDWPQEVGSELHKQLPFLNDYEVNVSLERKDDGRGFAFGYADVSNRTERPEVEHEEAGIPHIRIPIVAEERQVRPFSVFLDGERVLPMSEERIRETLFNPQMFDLSNSVPRDPSLVEPLMPPQRSGIGMGGEFKMASVKTAAMKATPSHWEGASGVGDVVDMWLKELQAHNARPIEPMDDKEKIAYLNECAEKATTGPMLGSLPYPLEKYKGTPLLKKAIELEKKHLAIDKEFAERDHNNPPTFVEKNKDLHAKRRKLDFSRRELELELADWQAGKIKVAYNHISKQQWDAIWHSDKIQKLLQKHGGNHKHPEITNVVYEIASKSYGYKPKVYPQNDEQKMQMMQKAQQKAQKDMEKQQKQMGGAAVPPGSGAAAAAGGKKKATGGSSVKVKKASLLEAIAPTIREKDRDAFIQKVASDSTLRAGFRRSGIAGLLVDVLDTKTASASDRLSALADSIEPTVVTFQKLPGGDFMVKSANVNAFAGGEQAVGQVMPLSEVVEAIGEPAKTMQPGQIATAVSNPVELAENDIAAGESVVEFGKYRVQTEDGGSLKGWVFPQMLSWDNEFTPHDTQLFVNGNTHAVKNTIVGEKHDGDAKPPVDIPKGEGVFWSADGSATAPITIKHGITAPNGVPRYVGVDDLGNEVTISVQPNLKTPQVISESEYAIPRSWNFMRLNKKVNLADSMGTSETLKKEKTSAVLFYNGSFHIKGGCGLDKVATELRQDMDVMGAEFILGLLGVDGVAAKQKVAEARRKGSIKLAGLKTITPLSNHYEEAVKTASALLKKLPNLQRDLVKEAAALEDHGTVDKVLALNFINPENLSTFIEYLPELEEASERMAEMVLAGYLGMKEIPVGAVERSMHNMEEVIEGLKAVQNAQVE